MWVGSQPSPRVSLERGATARGGKLIWNETSAWVAGKDGLGHFLGRGRQTLSVVLSQSCEIDKRGGKAPVLVAPVVPLSSITDDRVRENIRMGGRYAFFPLPAVDDIVVDSYVDLRAISYLPRNVLDSARRLASASEAGALDLAAHLVAFFTRIRYSAIAKPA